MNATRMIVMIEPCRVWKMSAAETEHGLHLSKENYVQSFRPGRSNERRYHSDDIIC